MSAFEVKEFSIEGYDISFRFEGEKGAELGVKFLHTIKEMSKQDFEHFIENNNLKEVE